MLPDYFDKMYATKKYLKDCLIFAITYLGLRVTTWKLRKQWSEVRHPSKDYAVVIAGGPSFTAEISKYLIEYKELYDIFAINYYCLNEISRELVPNYYILSDPAVLKTDDKSLLEKNARLQTYLKTHSQIILCTPIGEWQAKFSNDYINFDDRESLCSSNIDPRYPRGYTSNTSFKALAVAVKLGYKKVFVFGLDYDYPRQLVLGANNEVFLRDFHHYESGVSDYSSIYGNVAHALNWWSRDYYHLLKFKSTNVINVSPISLIDAFKRISFDEFQGMTEHSTSV
jgi:hypothetical protein